MLSRAESQTNVTTDFTTELKDVITSKLREIVSSVHSADNCYIAEELQEIQKLFIVLDPFARMPEEIFNLVSIQNFNELGTATKSQSTGNFAFLLYHRWRMKKMRNVSDDEH